MVFSRGSLYILNPEAAYFHWFFWPSCLLPMAVILISKIILKLGTKVNRILNRVISNGREEMFNILSHQGNEIKMTIRFHITSTSMYKIKDSSASTCCLGCDERETWRPSHVTPGHIPKRCSTIPKRQIFHYFYSSLICNSQELESTQMSLNLRMNTENVVHLQNGVLFSYEKNKDIMNFAIKWMELENIYLTEGAQT